MKFCTIAALALSGFGSVLAQKEIIQGIATCDPLVYADGHVYKSNDRSMKGFPAQNAFPVMIYLDEWAGYVAAAKMRLVRADDESYGNWKLTRFEDSMTIPFSGSGPVTFTHPSDLSGSEVNKYWTSDYGYIEFSEDDARKTQPRGGGFVWKKVDGYELEQLFWDKATYDRAKGDDNIQYGQMEVLCRGISTNAWNGQLTDQASP